LRTKKAASSSKKESTDEKPSSPKKETPRKAVMVEDTVMPTVAKKQVLVTEQEDAQQLKEKLSPVAKKPEPEAVTKLEKPHAEKSSIELEDVKQPLPVKPLELEKPPVENEFQQRPAEEIEQPQKAIEIPPGVDIPPPLSEERQQSQVALLEEPSAPIEALPEVEEIKIELTKQKMKRRGKKRKKIKEQVEEEIEGNAKKAKEKVAFSDRVLRFALKYTRYPTRIIAKRMPKLRDDLLRSSLRISPEGVISLSLLFTLISIPAAIFGAFELTRMGLGLYALAMPGVIVVPFLMGITIPKVSASSRAQALENELPYLFAYITVLAGGGISPMVTLKRISKAGKIFPAAAKEASRILMDIEIFGLDAISALEREARLTPNKTFSDFIGGYVAVLKTGGDALSYLEAKLKEIFTYREAKIRSGSEFIATMSEAYIITTVVMGVSLMILWATENLMSLNGEPFTATSVNGTLIIMFSGFAVPIISLIFIVVIGSSQVREPFSYDRPFYIFLACMPVGALTYYLLIRLPLGLAPYMALGLGLLAVSTPPMIIQMMYKKRKAGVEAKLSNFLRDLSEVRKTGLAPEKAIEQLANRSYGGLTIHVKKIAAQVSWGTPLKTVLQTFINEVKSWVSRAVAFLLLEVVDVGGGSAKMFISLADFTEKNDQLDKERKSQIRPYIIIPYIGAILVVATTAMMAYYAGFSATNIPGVPSNFAPSAAILQQATDILLMGAFFQAWVMGFVAGKMGEGSAADGFKHATLLIAISIVTVVVTSLFIKL
jgi:archaeal flagellar protein FlaJ